MHPFRPVAIAAAFLLSLSAAALGDDGPAAAACPVGQAFTAGAITVSGAYTRAMLPNAGAAGGYLTIGNSGGEADTLLGAESAAAGTVEIHQMKLEGDVMMMSRVDGGLEVPAGGELALEPMGYHLMFMQVATPFAEGGCVEVTLHLAKAGDLPIQLNVGGVAQREPPMAHAHEHDMSETNEMSHSH